MAALLMIVRHCVPGSSVGVFGIVRRCVARIIPDGVRVILGVLPVFPKGDASLRDADVPPCGII